MNKNYKWLSIYCLILILMSSLFLSMVVVASEGKIENMVLVSGSGMNRISLIDGNGDAAWEMFKGDISWEEVNDADMLSNGNVVFAARANSGSTVYMIKPNYAKKRGYDVVWSYQVPSDAENHTCQVLPDGGILLCEAYAEYIRIVELDADGQVRFTLGGQDSPLEGWPKISDRHGQVRQIHKTAEGTYLVASMSTQKTFEYDANGKKLAEYAAGGFTAIKDRDGNVIVSGGSTNRITCFDAETKKVLWRIQQTDLEKENITFGFIAAIELKENGNLVFANWGGHGGASGDAVMEVTLPTDEQRPQLVWSLNCGGSTSNVQVIDHVDPAIFEGKTPAVTVGTENGDSATDDTIGSDDGSNDQDAETALWWILPIAVAVIVIVIVIVLRMKKK